MGDEMSERGGAALAGAGVEERVAGGPPLNNETLAEKVYLWLREQILNGEIAQGERLNETSLGKRLGVSATPVREAMRLLNGDGLVEYYGRRGVKVIEPSEADVLHCFAVRRALECLAVRQAVPRLNERERQAYYDLALRTAEAEGQPPRALFDVDGSFHAFLVARADNRWLSSFLATLSGVLTVVRLPLFSAASVERTTLEHLQVAEAVRHGDVEEAVNRLDAHIERVCNDVIRILRSAGETPGDFDGRKELV